MLAVYLVLHASGSISVLGSNQARVHFPDLGPDSPP